ncbi:MAG: hypothetical protein AABN34_16920 [Acidobacteriota bacterium]
MAEDIATVVPDEERQEPARSQSTSVSIDARISVYPLGEDHPLAHMFGKYADDPMWRELEEIMERNRVSDGAAGDA